MVGQEQAAVGELRAAAQHQLAVCSSGIPDLASAEIVNTLLNVVARIDRLRAGKLQSNEIVPLLGIELVRLNKPPIRAQVVLVRRRSVFGIPE